MRWLARRRLPFERLPAGDPSAPGLRFHEVPVTALDGASGVIGSTVAMSSRFMVVGNPDHTVGNSGVAVGEVRIVAPVTSVSDGSVVAWEERQLLLMYDESNVARSGTSGCGNIVGVSDDGALVTTCSSLNVAVFFQQPRCGTPAAECLWQRVAVVAATLGERFLDVTLGNNVSVLQVALDGKSHGELRLFRRVGDGGNATWHMFQTISTNSGHPRMAASGRLFAARRAIEDGMYAIELVAPTTANATAPTWRVVRTVSPPPGSVFNWGTTLALAGSYLVVSSNIESTMLRLVATANNGTVALPAATAVLGNDTSLTTEVLATWLSRPSVAVSETGVVVTADVEAALPNVRAVPAEAWGPTPSTIRGERLTSPFDDADGEDYFGYAVSWQGRRAFVGARFADKPPGAAAGVNGSAVNNTGAVHVHECTHTSVRNVTVCGNWSRVGALRPWQDRYERGSSFGNAITTSPGGTTAVASRFSDLVAPLAGQVQLYEGNATTASQLLVPPTSTAGHNFGTAFAMSGTTAVIGSPDNNLRARKCGVADVFVLQEGGWVHTTTLHPRTAVYSMLFGSAVAVRAPVNVSRATIAVGATQSPMGVVEVFERGANTTGEWTRVAVLQPNCVGCLIGASHTLALAETWLAVAAPASNAAGTLSGAVYMYRRNMSAPAAAAATGTLWTLAAVLTTPNPVYQAYARFGTSLASHGASLFVGAQLSVHSLKFTAACTSSTAPPPPPARWLPPFPLPTPCRSFCSARTSLLQMARSLSPPFTPVRMPATSSSTVLWSRRTTLVAGGCSSRQSRRQRRMQTTGSAWACRRHGTTFSSARPSTASAVRHGCMTAPATTASRRGSWRHTSRRLPPRAA